MPPPADGGKVPFLSQNNGEWYSVYDVTGSGTDVYKVDFFNIDTNRNMEIGVIWTLDDSKRDKNFSVYKINSLEAGKENSVVSLATIQISDYAYCDVDGDTADELLYFYFDGKSENATVNARLIDYNSIDNTLVPLSEVALPFVFSSVKQILFDLENNKMRFYFDFISSSGTYFTEVIVYSRESEALSIPLLNGRNISSLSVRNSETFCCDFDNDGYYDIPLTLKYDDSYAVSGSDGSEAALTFVHWYTYFDASFKSIGKYFINYYDDYSMKIDSVYDKFYIVYDIVNRVTQVCVKKSGDEKNIVFSVALSKKQEDTVSILPDGFLGANDENRFNIVISATGESYSFSEAFVKSLISDLKE